MPKIFGKMGTSGSSTQQGTTLFEKPGPCILAEDNSLSKNKTYALSQSRTKFKLLDVLCLLRFLKATKIFMY